MSNDLKVFDELSGKTRYKSMSPVELRWECMSKILLTQEMLLEQLTACREHIQELRDLRAAIAAHLESIRVDETVELDR